MVSVKVLKELQTSCEEGGRKSRESENMKAAAECCSTVSDSLIWDTGWENTGDLLIRRPRSETVLLF